MPEGWMEEKRVNFWGVHLGMIDDYEGSEVGGVRLEHCHGLKLRCVRGVGKLMPLRWKPYCCGRSLRQG